MLVRSVTSGKDRFFRSFDLATVADTAVLGREIAMNELLEARVGIGRLSR